MEIKIQIRSATLDAKQMNEQQVKEVIKCFFDALKPESIFFVEETSELEVSGGNIFEKNEYNGLVGWVPNALRDSEKTRDIENIKLDRDGPGDTVFVEEIETNPRSRQLPLTGSTRSTNSIAEVAKVVEVSKGDEPEHWKTGIQVSEDGTKRYRAYYWCDCGNKGKRYIPKDKEFLHCHSCNEKLYVDAATLELDNEGLPKRDKFGNFYVAREMVLVPFEE